MSATEIHSRLRELRAERAIASIAGLAPDAAYMVELDEEIAATHYAFVMAAVREIAVRRAELWGAPAG